jgi:hypothetical protein
VEISHANPLFSILVEIEQLVLFYICEQPLRNLRRIRVHAFS